MVLGKRSQVRLLWNRRIEHRQGGGRVDEGNVIVDKTAADLIAIEAFWV